MRFPASIVGIAALVAAGVTIAACSSGNDTTVKTPTATVASSSSASAGSGGSGGGGSGGAGGSGPPPGELCVSSPVPAAFAGTDACPAPQPNKADTFDAALAKGGLDRCAVHLFPADVALSGWGTPYIVDKRRLPDFTPLQRGPLRLPAYGKETAAWLDAAIASKTPVSDTIAALSVRRGHVITNACEDLTPYLPAMGDATPLATAVLALDTNQGFAGDEAAVKAAAMVVPLAVQQKLAPIVGAIDLAATAVKKALKTTAIAELKYLGSSHGLYVPALSGFSTTTASLATLDAVDLDAMTDSAALLAKAIESADLGSLADAKFPAFEVVTPIGGIVVHDSSNDTYADGGVGAATALLFDLGGDDTYEVPAGAADWKTPVSIAIDVRGKDHYGYKIVASPLDTGLLPSDSKGRYKSISTPDKDDGPITLSRQPRQGAGTGGIGLLFNYGPEDDTYLSLAISQGFASTGVGVLFDQAGDDDYEAEVGVQGAATFGVAALVDLAGNDTHKAFAFSQGFGGAVGAAALVDGAGDDVYFCDSGNPAIGGHPLYLSPQLPGKGNSSMSQGAAQGRMPQSGTDTSYMAGGLGVLRDLSGKDQYAGSVFAQGVGYWQGIGLLMDGGTDNDTYDAYWYIQGSSAHFALSLFVDEGGDDIYNATLPPAATSIGLGHDFSASIHLDLGGNDIYHAPGLSLGSGNINGIGCFVNIGGDDTYIAGGDPTFGAGNYSDESPYGDPRQQAATIGIFVDVGGTDTYTVGGMSRALDDTTWSYDPQPYPDPMMVTTEHGCGADDGNGTVSLP